MPTTVTSTIKPSGGDYTTLSAWEAAKQGNIVTADQIQQAECYNMSDTTAVVVDGWTTDATRYIRIYGVVSDKTASNTGKWVTDRYRLEGASASNGAALSILEAYVRVDSLQVSGDATSTNFLDVISFGTNYPSAAYIEVTNCVVKGINDNYGSGVYIKDSAGKIYNNVIYDMTGNTSYGIYTNVSYAQLDIYNNTFVNTDYGIRGTAQVYAKNNVFRSCALAPTISMTAANCGYNSTDVASLGYTSQTGDRTSQTFTFVDEGNDNFHLASSDAGAKDFGTDLSTTFTVDVDGQTRSGSWDIGADEYIAAGGLSIPVAVHHYNQMRNV